MQNEENYESYDNAYDEDDPIANALLENRLSGFGLASMILGILSLLIWLPCFPLAGGFSGIGQLLFGLIALILGVVGLKKKKKKNALAVVGIILGAVSVLMGGVMLVLATVSALYIISDYGLEEFGYFITTLFDYLDYL